jgi:hypothetical protein
MTCCLADKSMVKREAKMTVVSCDFYMQGFATKSMKADVEREKI